jgi:uncharacterized protein CbrC (UPF0167 family)
MPTFAELGIPFPLYQADIGHAKGYYAGLADCALCGQTRAHCFAVDELILPCIRCDREMAFNTRSDKQVSCPHCDTTQPPLAAPRDQYRHILVCYACLRAGRAAFAHDTVVGIVTWEPAQAGHTLEMPVKPEPEPQEAHYAASASQYGFEHVIVARKPWESGGPDMDWEAVRVPQPLLMELLRTPSYSTWQGEHWLFCCKQPMVYLGDWGPADFEQYAGAGNGRALFETVAPDTDYWLWGHGGAGIYVFRCRACGRLDSHCDFD